jgi:uncharacterized protein
MADSEEIFTSAIAYVEFRASLAAAHRAGRFSVDGFAVKRAEFERLWQEICEVEIEWPVRLQAADLAEDKSLRGYDAIHLASLVHVASLRKDIRFACWDRVLHEAAAKMGYEVLPPLSLSPRSALRSSS